MLHFKYVENALVRVPRFGGMTLNAFGVVTNIAHVDQKKRRATTN